MLTSEAISAKSSAEVPPKRKASVRTRVTSGLAALVCTISLSALVVLGALTSFTLFPAMFGWQPDVILSGSMAPSILPGDVVVSSPITPSQIIEGRVVLVDNPSRRGELLMHRVASINKDGTIITRGDANNAVDSTPVPAASVRGLPRIRVPMIGLPALWMHNDQWFPLVGSAGGLLLALWGATAIRTPVGELEASTRPS